MRHPTLLLATWILAPAAFAQVVQPSEPLPVVSPDAAAIAPPSRVTPHPPLPEGVRPLPVGSWDVERPPADAPGVSLTGDRLAVVAQAVEGSATAQALVPGGPVGIPDLYLARAGAALSVAAPGFLMNDVDPDGEALTAVSILDTPEHGTLVAFANGSFSYVPDAGFTGTDAFVYQMRDASSNTSDPVTVTLAVLDPDDPVLALACPTSLVISDFRTVPNAQEYVDLQNVGSTPIDFATVDCVLGAFRETAYLALSPSGTLAPDGVLRFGASGAPGVDVPFPDGSLANAKAGLALLTRDGLAAGTPVADVAPDVVTSLVYLSTATVYGFFHVDAETAKLYCSLYAGELHPNGQSQCASSSARVATSDGGSPAVSETGLASMLAAVHAEAGDAEESPVAFEQGSVYPNPLRTEGTLRLDLPTSEHVRVVLYDSMGREAAVLHDGPLGVGQHEVSLDARALASGMYIVRVTAGSLTATRQIAVVH